MGYRKLENSPFPQVLLKYEQHSGCPNIFIHKELGRACLQKASSFAEHSLPRS